MLKVLFCLYFCIAIFSPVNANASSAEAEEVKVFLSHLIDALNDQDLNEIASSWGEEGELVTLAGGIYKGRKEIKDLFTESFKSPDRLEHQHFIQNIRFNGNKAYVDGVWRTKNGPENYPSCGIFLYNLSKVNGVWQIDISYSSVPRHGHTAEHGRTLSWVKICKG